MENEFDPSLDEMLDALQSLCMVMEIEFHMLTAEQLRKRSVQTVTTSTMFEQQTQMPLPHGIMSPAFGCDGNLTCTTCQNTSRCARCVGHPGDIQLAAPCQHSALRRLLPKLLMCMCHGCGACLIPQERWDVIAQTSPEKRLSYAAQQCPRNRACGNAECRLPGQPSYRADGYLGVQITWPPDMHWESQEQMDSYLRRPFTLEVVRDILMLGLPNVSKVLGFAEDTTHESFVIEANGVAPMSARPSFMGRVSDHVKRHPHDMTQLYQFILKPNEDMWRAVREAGVNAETLNELQLQLDAGLLDKDPRKPKSMEDLRTHVHMLMNTKAVMNMSRKGRGGQSLKIDGGIQQALDGKKGLIRGHAAGFRPESNARIDLLPAPPTWPLFLVGVPEFVANILVKPMRVWEHNLNDAVLRIRRGAYCRGGANIIVMPNGEMRRIDEMMDSERHALADTLLSNGVYGWTLYRTLEDGDMVAINREPSLHLQSEQAFPCKIISGYALRIHHLLALAFNLDFDGDAIALHLPLDDGSHLEFAFIMSAINCMISPTSGFPITAPTLHPAMGFYTLTDPTTRVPGWLVRILVAVAAEHFPERYRAFAGSLTHASVLPEPWRGADILSLSLPETAYWEGGSDAYTNPGTPLVSAGRWLKGRCRLAAATQGRASLTQAIHSDFGQVEAARFLACLSGLCDVFTFYHGCNTHAGEILAHKDKRGVGALIRDKVWSALDAIPVGHPAELKLRMSILSVGTGLVDVTDTCLAGMYAAKVKGSEENAAQIQICGGQEYVGGSSLLFADSAHLLPPYVGLTGRQLPPEAHGLVTSSFGNVWTATPGLSPVELLCQEYSGFDNLSNTSSAVPATGDFQRNMSSGTKTIQVRGDCPMRSVYDSIERDTGHKWEPGDTRRAVIQYAYGGTGLDIVKCEQVEVPALTVPVQQMTDVPGVSPDVCSRWRHEIVVWRTLAVSRSPILHSHWMVPVAWGRWLRHAVVPASTDTPEEEWAFVESEVLQPMRDVMAAYGPVWAIVLVDALWWWSPWSPARAWQGVGGLDMAACVHKYVTSLDMARVSIGASVALIASYGMSESMVQGQLDKFHASGSGSAEVSDIHAYRRIRQIATASKTSNVKYIKLAVRPGAEEAIQAWAAARCRPTLKQLSVSPCADTVYEDVHTALWAEIVGGCRAAGASEPWTTGLRITVGVVHAGKVNLRAVAKGIWKWSHRVLAGSPCAELLSEADLHTALIPYMNVAEDSSMSIRVVASPVVWIALASATWVRSSSSADTIKFALQALLHAVNTADFGSAVDFLIMSMGRVVVTGPKLGCVSCPWTIVRPELTIVERTGKAAPRTAVRHARWDPVGQCVAALPEGGVKFLIVHGPIDLELIGELDEAGWINPELCEFSDFMGVATEFGCEAAWSVISSEILSCVADKVSKIHADLLADKATGSGFPTPIIPSNNIKTGSVVHAAMQSKATQSFAYAALFGIKDDVRNGTTSLIVGRPPKIGTYAVDVRNPAAHTEHKLKAHTSARGSRGGAYARSEQRIQQQQDANGQSRGATAGEEPSFLQSLGINQEPGKFHLSIDNRKSDKPYSTAKHTQNKLRLVKNERVSHERLLARLVPGIIETR